MEKTNNNYEKDSFYGYILFKKKGNKCISKSKRRFYNYMSVICNRNISRPVISYIDMETKKKRYNCPNCRKEIYIEQKNNIPNYCYKCGQKISF